MGKVNTNVTPVKLICGLITKDLTILDKTIEILKESYGELDYKSEIVQFNHTDYYEKELGKNLKRQFISFQNLIHPDNLSNIKLNTNNIEDNLSINNKRVINIDPGYLTLAKLVLATTKDRDHRIYIGNYIYAEVTLHYTQKTFKPFPWTYLDYTTQEYINIFNNIRSIYYQQLKTFGIL